MNAVLSVLAGTALLLARIWLLSPGRLAALSPWLAGLALLLQFCGYQLMMAASEPKKLSKGMAWAQRGWILLGLSLPGVWAAQGALNFILLQAVLLYPLEQLLLGEDWLRPGLLLLAFLALIGCIPFFSFSAYFQTFIPLMSVGDGVSTMHQKLFSMGGLLASVTMLSVVYQSCALGYFYWARVFGRQGAAGWSRPAIGLAAALLASLCLGLSPEGYSRALRTLLLALGYQV